MKQLRLYKKPDGKWYIRDDAGEHPVSFKLAGNGWESMGAVADGPATLDELVKIEVCNKTYEIWISEAGEMTIYTYSSNGKPNILVDEFYIGYAHPAAGFFKKTGVDPRGETITIPIYHVFNKQKY